MQSVVKTIKNQRVNWIPVKVVLFLLLLGFIGYRLWREDWSGVNMLQLKHPEYLVLAFLLIAVNQGCEWFKWKVTAGHLISDTSVLRKSFFGGIGTGFLTPNGWGNFLGRIVFFRRRDRMYIILASFVANVSQVLPTILFGAIACFSATKVPTGFSWIVFSAGGLILIAFFFGERLFPSRGSRNKLVRHFRSSQERLGNLRLPLFLWSNLRFQVFSLQYVLLFMAFGYSDVWFLLTNVWMLFLLTSFVPSLWSGKIVIRETAAIFLFTGTMVAVPDAVMVSLLIWLFNSIIPAAVSSCVWMPVSKRKAHVVD